MVLIIVRGARPGKNVQLTENEIRGLCLKSREIFLSQPILLELEAPLKICGKYIQFPLLIFSVQIFWFDSFKIINVILILSRSFFISYFKQFKYLSKLYAFNWLNVLPAEMLDLFVYKMYRRLIRCVQTKFMRKNNELICYQVFPTSSSIYLLLNFDIFICLKLKIIAGREIKYHLLPKLT